MTASSSNDYLLKKEALKKIVEHNRDYLKLDLTLPLGDPALKNVHTNQWLFTELPAEFDLANWTIIAEHLNANTNRYESYVKNRWYIESCDISVEAGGKCTMKLGLNAFASTYNEFTDAFKKFQDDYKSAQSSSGSSTSASKKTTNATAGSNSSLKGGQGTVIDNLVKKICGSETNELKKAKLIHSWLQDNVRYKLYCCAKYRTAEECYNNRGSLNCADTATLTCRMMLSAGLNAYIVHRTYNGGHYWTVIEIGGQKYASDQTGDGSEWNTVWKASGRTGNGGYADYSSRNGDFPDCYPAEEC